jgi:hypothetical protein
VKCLALLIDRILGELEPAILTKESMTFAACRPPTAYLPVFERQGKF